MNDDIEIRIFLRDCEADKTVVYTLPLEEYKRMLLHKENVLETIINELEMKLKHE